jgi:hypothetical protein
VKWLRVARHSGDLPGSPQSSGGESTLSDDILASALEDLEAGLTPTEVLDRYGAYEDALAPLLQTAYELRTTRWPAMSMAGRVAGRERMHAALAARTRRGSGLISPVWRQVGVGLALMLMAGAAFLASPYSPLDLPRQGSSVTPTQGAPLVSAPTPTVVPGVLPLATTSPATMVATATSTATLRSTDAVRTIEPSETPERLLSVASTRAVTPTSTVTLAPTRRATRASTPTPAPAATASVPAAPTATSADNDSSATSVAPPSPTVVTAITPTPLPIKPTPTMTVWPTEPPPTVTWTAAPPTATSTRRASATPQPEPTVAPTETPEPTETPRPRPRLTQSPEPTRTPRHTESADQPLHQMKVPAGLPLNARPAALPALIRAARPEGRRP